jgi:enamine deaminase RidA (YjgF/YER057c/UK114 family)
VSQTRFINPEALSRPPGYTHVIEATAPARLVYIAGQLGIDREGKFSSDFRLQAVQTFENHYQGGATKTNVSSARTGSMTMPDQIM